MVPKEGVNVTAPEFAINAGEVMAWDRAMKKALNDAENPTTESGGVKYMTVNVARRLAVDTVKVAWKAVQADTIAIGSAVASGLMLATVEGLVDGRFTGQTYIDAAALTAATTYVGQTFFEIQGLLPLLLTNPKEAFKDALFTGPKAVHRAVTAAAIYSWGTYTPHLSALLASPAVTKRVVDRYFATAMEEAMQEDSPDNPEDVIAVSHMIYAFAEAGGLDSALSIVSSAASAMSTVGSSAMTLFNDIGDVVRSDPEFYAPANEVIDAATATVGHAVGGQIRAALFGMLNVLRGFVKAMVDEQVSQFRSAAGDVTGFL